MMENSFMHLAIIPDGNRRWAKKRNLPSFMGHKTGAEAMEKVISDAFDLGVTHLTIWGASVANVTERVKEETDFLFSVFKDSFKKLIESKELADRKVKVRILGEWRSLFPADLCTLYEEMIASTSGNGGPSLTFMMAYSGTGDMLSAAKKLSAMKAADDSFEVTRESLKAALATSELPPVDLVIRTGGEPHWSDGFMMWDTANSQLYFTETLWPDFGADELKVVVERFGSTERRLGK